MILLYGATGFTGRIVARALADAALETVLAGRTAANLRAVAGPLGLAIRVGGLDDVDLSGVEVVVNCAGPFARTQPPLLARCLDRGIHYLDLAGEVDEHRAAWSHDGRARAAGVLVLPGAGFGIVASDCLAAHVAARVGVPTSVEIALVTRGGVSRGTAEVVLGSLRLPGVRRAAGELVPVRFGASSRRVDLGDGHGPTLVVSNPWRADVVASVPAAPAYEAFMAFPAPVRLLARVPQGGLMRRVAARLPEGPSAKALARGTSAVWARAVGADGAEATAVLRGPDAYLLTGLTVSACASRVLGGDAPPGVHTPAGAWGPDLVLGLDGVERDDG